MKIELTEFVKRQWKPNFAGTKMHRIQEAKFLELFNDAYNVSMSKSISMNHKFDSHKSWDFCKYLYLNVERTLDIRTSTVKLDHTIAPFVQCDYSSRNSAELEVLGRWVSFPAQSNFKAPLAKWIGCVLYTREQLLEEYNKNADEHVHTFELSEDCEYGIVAIMGLDIPQMDPMPPITHFRNALGQEFGGNGEPVDIEEYNKSVEFWKNNILIK